MFELLENVDKRFLTSEEAKNIYDQTLGMRTEDIYKWIESDWWMKRELKQKIKSGIKNFPSPPDFYAAEHELEKLGEVVRFKKEIHSVRKQNDEQQKENRLRIAAKRKGREHRVKVDLDLTHIEKIDAMFPIFSRPIAIRVMTEFFWMHRDKLQDQLTQLADKMHKEQYRSRTK